MSESQIVYSLRATADDCADEGNPDRAMLLRACAAHVAALEERDHVADADRVILTPEVLRALRADPTTAIEDDDEWHRRVGWLVCVLDVIGALPELQESAA